MKRLETTAILLIAAILTINAFAFTANDKSIIGQWDAPALDNAKVKVYEASDGLLYGRVLSADDPAIVGKLILRKFKYNAEENEWEGEIHSPKRNMTIDGVITLESADKLKLVGTKFFMSKTFY